MCFGDMIPKIAGVGVHESLLVANGPWASVTTQHKS